MGDADGADPRCAAEVQRRRSEKLMPFMAALEAGELDEAVVALDDRLRRLMWSRLPSRIIILRHGESEGNVNELMYTNKGDSKLELTARGLRQAEEAGTRLRPLVGCGSVFVCLSPFERTQQTLLGLYRGGFPQEQVEVVHVESQIREQEFGNFQDPGLNYKVRAEQRRVGRFYYRRPNAESSADVYDRVSQFWDKLLASGNDALLLRHGRSYETCLIVTHGLTLRMLLMRIFNWSVETFETVWNLGNAQHVTLIKNMDTLCYEMCPAESFPARIPWATREIWLVLKAKKATEETEWKLRQLLQCADAIKAAQKERGGDNGDADEADDKWSALDAEIDALQSLRMQERSVPCTIIDYLSISTPRTQHTLEVLARLIPGHRLQQHPEEMLARLPKTPLYHADELEFIDWWGDLLSYRGKMLYMPSNLSKGKAGGTTGPGEPEEVPCWSIHCIRRPSSNTVDSETFSPRGPSSSMSPVCRGRNFGPMLQVPGR